VKKLALSGLLALILVSSGCWEPVGVAHGGDGIVVAIVMNRISGEVCSIAAMHPQISEEVLNKQFKENKRIQPWRRRCERSGDK
jgi:hypothetical protein